MKGKKGGSVGCRRIKDSRKTRLGASNIATLEKIWETGNHYPDDMTIQGIRDADELPARQDFRNGSRRKETGEESKTPRREE